MCKTENCDNVPLNSFTLYCQDCKCKYCNNPRNATSKMCDKCACPRCGIKQKMLFSNFCEDCLCQCCSKIPHDDSSVYCFKCKCKKCEKNIHANNSAFCDFCSVRFGCKTCKQELAVSNYLCEKCINPFANTTTTTTTPIFNPNPNPITTTTTDIISDGTISEPPIPSTADSQQLEAIVSKKRFLLILAGPGSGKTFTLIHRINYVAFSSPGFFADILVTTFSRAAAREIIHRLKYLTRNDPNKQSLSQCINGTLHSICFRILKECKFMQDDVTVLSNYNQKKIVEKILTDNHNLVPQQIQEKIKMDKKEFGKYIKSVLQIYDKKCTNTSNDFEKEYQIHPSNINATLALYQQQKIKTNCIDFNDILTIFYRKISGDPTDVTTIFSSSLGRIKHVFFDEYQDINPLQYEILKIIVKQLKSSLVNVGDFRQTIYSFRGSDNSIIHNFEKDFVEIADDQEEIGIINLVNNYRSSGAITKSCFNYIKANNTMMNDIEMVSKRDVDSTKYHDPIYYKFKNDVNNPEKMYNSMKNMIMDKKFKLSEQVVLCRHRLPLRMFGNYLFKKKINYEESGSSVLQKKEIQDLIALWNFIVNPQNHNDLMRVLKLLPKIGEKTAQDISNQIYAVETSVNLPEIDLSLIQDKELEEEEEIFGEEYQHQGAGPLDWMDATSSMKTVEEKNVDKENIISILLNNDKTVLIGKLLDQVWKEADSPVIKITREFITSEEFITSAYKSKNPKDVIELIDTFIKIICLDENIDDKSDDKSDFNTMISKYKLVNLQTILLELNLYQESGEEYSETGHVKVDKLLLCTIHAAKGKEWKRVMIILDEEYNFKNSKMSQEQIEKEQEEEARILFVAFSRAQFELACFEKIGTNIPKILPPKNLCQDTTSARYINGSFNILCEKHAIPLEKCQKIECSESSCECKQDVLYARQDNKGKFDTFKCEIHKLSVPKTLTTTTTTTLSKSNIVEEMNIVPCSAIVSNLESTSTTTTKITNKTPNISRYDLLLEHFKVVII